MRFILRAIIFGILTGAFLFFFPFHFFLFPVLLVFLVARLFFRPWRWRHRFQGYGPYGYGHHRFAGHDSWNDAGDDITSAMPIDGFNRGNATRSSNRQADRNINIQ